MEEQFIGRKRRKVDQSAQAQSSVTNISLSLAIDLPELRQQVSLFLKRGLQAAVGCLLQQDPGWWGRQQKRAESLIKCDALRLELAEVDDSI